MAACKAAAEGPNLAQSGHELGTILGAENVVNPKAKQEQLVNYG
jgi:hypothetical protein